VDVEHQIEHLTERLQQRYKCDKRDIQIVYSPLRFSPLGAHVDHQDGLVTGMTLDRVILLAFAPRSDRRVHVESINFAGTVEFALDDVPPAIPGNWGNYVRGAVLALTQEYHLNTGIHALVQGDMPIGGLSSSAAVGVAYLLALEAANGLQITPEENIQLDRYIENEYLGLKNGILDQSVILMSDFAHLTYLDCQTLEFAKFPTTINSRHLEVVVVHSGLNKPLSGTSYNKRVEECQQAARMMLEWANEPIPETPRLRMVPEEIYASLGNRLPAPLDRRARHFFTEIQRVREGIVAWQKGDLETMGHLINESGASSIHNYECGCPHLITLYDILKRCPGVYGTRFSGGGFRGSCVGLIDPAAREEIKDIIDAQYPIAHPDVADSYSIHFCRPDGPARRLD
jgi:galactokinase